MCSNGLKIGLTLLVTALPALAQLSPSIVANQDNNSASRYIGSRNSARTPDGQILMVFEPGELYATQDIYWTLYDPLEDSWSVPQALSQAANVHTGSGSLVADENGNVYAYWKELNGSGDREAMFSAWSGSSWSTPAIADNLAGGNAGMGTIAVADDGTLFNLFSTWSTGSDYDANIYSGQSSDGGVSWTTDNLNGTFPTPNQLPLTFLDVCLTPGSNGTMYAAWEDRPFDASWECMLAYYDGSSWQMPEVASTLSDSLGILKYVDGVTPRAAAQAVHEMGPAGYALAGEAVEVYYDSGTYRTLSTFYNLRYVSPIWNRDELVADVVTHFAPASILVVDDDNRYDHESYLTDALDNNGITYDVLDTDADDDLIAESPDAATLAAYDLVIWFCGDDGGNIAYWEDAGTYETTNPDITAYLDGGGDMWTIGLDVLYDRYSGAPDAFIAGDFPYDYLGLASYDVQAWADDAHVGLAQADLVLSQTITDVGPLFWGVGGIRQGEPSITVGNNDDLHMVYVEGGGIFHRAWNGTTWTAAVAVDASGAATAMRPCIVSDSQGGLYTTWVQETGQEPTIWNVIYSTSTDGGVTWSTPTQLSNATTASFGGYSVRYPTMGITVRPPIPGVFDGGADVSWIQWNDTSALGFDLMYGRIPFLGLEAVSPLEISTGINLVTLSWQAVAEATSYNVYAAGEGFGSFVLLGTVPAGTTTYDHPFTNNEKTYFRVTAVK